MSAHNELRHGPNEWTTNTPTDAAVATRAAHVSVEEEGDTPSQDLLWRAALRSRRPARASGHPAGGEQSTASSRRALRCVPGVMPDSALHIDRTRRCGTSIRPSRTVRGPAAPLPPTRRGLLLPRGRMTFHLTNCRPARRTFGHLSSAFLAVGCCAPAAVVPEVRESPLLRRRSATY